MCYEECLRKYIHKINWAVADLMGLEVIWGPQTDNTRSCGREGDGEEEGREQMFTMLWCLWKALDKCLNMQHPDFENS